MSALRRLVVGRVVQVLLWSLVTVSARLFRVDRVGGGGPQQGADGDGGPCMPG